MGEIEPRVLVPVDRMENLHYIARLEEAYVSSRYLPISYEDAEVRDMLRFVKEVFGRIVESS